MRIHGETDNALRADLAEARAAACVAALVSAGISRGRLSSSAAATGERRVSFIPSLAPP